SKQPAAECFDIREHLLSCGICWCLHKLIIHIRWLLATLNHTTDRPLVDGGNGTHMLQDISRRPFPLFWRCAKGGVRESSSCCQKNAGAPLAVLRQAALVYDALPDLLDNYEREQPLLRVSPVFPVP